jgi:hypothetical protein
VKKTRKTAPKCKNIRCREDSNFFYLHGKNPEHLMDSLDGQAVKVGEHRHNVGPED